MQIWALDLLRVGRPVRYMFRTKQYGRLAHRQLGRFQVGSVTKTALISIPSLTTRHVCGCAAERVGDAHLAGAPQSGLAMRISRLNLRVWRSTGLRPGSDHHGQ